VPGYTLILKALQDTRSTNKKAELTITVISKSYDQDLKRNVEIQSGEFCESIYIRQFANRVEGETKFAKELRVPRTLLHWKAVLKSRRYPLQ
jgi:hypothetical protein